MEVFIAVWLLCAVATAIVANNKGRSGFGWFVLGLVFGILALIAVAIVSTKNTPQVVVMPGTPAGPTRQCPHCHSLIPLQASVCRFCQREVPDAVAQGRRLLANGQCPSCLRPVPTTSKACRHCGAQYAGLYG